MSEPYQIHHGDSLDVLHGMVDNSIDAIVTDPPYGLSFMGKRWDYDVPTEDLWRECLRVLKPGGHLLAFAGTRTQHRMAVRIEDAGFEIRDMIAWVYGSGFPKSMNVSKAIDREAGAEREVVGKSHHAAKRSANGGYSGWTGLDERHITAPATPEAQQWEGWGTALKPALEPITVARKPLDGTVAHNVLTWGTGGVNVDGCRVGTGGETITATRNIALGSSSSGVYGAADKPGVYAQHPSGRWPANLIHDGSEEVVGLFPETGHAKAAQRGAGKGATGCYGVYGGESTVRGHDDAGGSAARFFYCAKASKRDRDEGCEGMPKTIKQSVAHGDKRHGTLPYTNEPREMHPRPRTNHHPTVKPTDLMRYLCRLVTPPGGIVLDPFMGSGSTGKAAILEGFRFVGIEREAEYIDIARARIAHVTKEPNLWRS